MTDEDAGTAPALLTARQVALRLGVAERTVQRWSREGRLPPAEVTLGGWQLWDPREVDAAVARALESKRRKV